MTPLPLALLLLLAPLPPQAKPAPPPPELAATVQYSPAGDLCGPWQTFVVELDSRSTRDLDLTVRIEDDTFLSVATRRERLSPGSKKRLFLYGSSGSFQRGVPARYRITDARGAELAAGSFPNPSRGSAPQTYQVGLYSRIPAAEDDFGIPTSINGSELRCGRLSSATLPDRWIGFSGIDLLIVHDAPLDELTADQVRALHDYVKLGGTVLFIPGITPGWLQHPVIQALAPVRAEPAKHVSSLPGLNGAYGNFRGNDPFLAQALLNGAGLLPDLRREELARFGAGFGQALVVGADLRRAPFDTWAGRRQFWSTLVQHVPRWSQEDPGGFPIAANAGQREDLFQRMGRLINPYPSFGLILGLAVVFLGAVGPANYMVLWKLRRTLLLVVTVPGISLAFLALIVLLGYVLKGTSTVVHSARLLTTRSGLGVARETHLYSLFSPSTRSYDLTLEPGSFGPFDRWALNDRDNWRGRREGINTLTCETGSSMTIRDVGTGQWQSWNLETRALRDLAKGVRFSVEGGQLKIDNGSARLIERGIYVQTGPESGSQSFGPVEAGKSIAAALGPPRRDGGTGLDAGSGSLDDTLLGPWLASLLDPRFGSGVNPAPAQRFLICVLKDEGDPVAVNARLSGRSRSLTLLHVAEEP